MAEENTGIQQAGSLPVVENHYCPSEIVDIFSDFLSRAGLGSKVVFVTGIYLKTAKQNYGGFFYDTLRDQNSDQELTLKMPQNLRDDLDGGSLITVGGTIYKNSGNKGNIQLGFRVTRVSTIQQQAVSEEDMKRSELRNLKTQRGFANVDSILENILMKGERPHIALVFATSSITMSDFDAGKHAAEASMDFDEYRVNFASSHDLCSALERIDTMKYDVISLVRGGGSGIEHLDDLNVIEAVVGLKTPFICAVGHVEEKIFIKLVSDKVAPTPNGLGSWFSELAEKVTKTRQDSIAVITKQVQKQFQERLDVQVKQNKELNEKLAALTKQSEEAQKQNAEGNKKLTEQLAEANKKNGELSETIKGIKQQAEETQKQNAENSKKLTEQLADANKKNGEMAQTLQVQTKAHAEQMAALNKNLEEFKKSSEEQSKQQSEVLQGFQKSNADLVSRNASLTSEIEQLKANTSKGIPSWVVWGMAAVIMILTIVLCVR